MAGQSLMRTLARWHIWLGWIAGLPLLVWIVSGLIMTVRPIEQVRGDDLRLRRDPAALQLPVPWRAALPQIREARILGQNGKPVMIATTPDGTVKRYDMTDEGLKLRSPVTEGEARRVVRAAIRGGDAIATAELFEAARSPLDFRRPIAAWRITLADGTRVYVGRDSGEIEAVRTRWWRFYDLMWGLHIMDPTTREDTSNPLLWTFGGVSLASAFAGIVLLFRRRRRRIQGPVQS